MRRIDAKLPGKMRRRRGTVADTAREAVDVRSAASLARAAARSLSAPDSTAESRLDALELLVRDPATLRLHESMVASCLDDEAWFV